MIEMIEVTEQQSSEIVALNQGIYQLSPIELDGKIYYPASIIGDEKYHNIQNIVKNCAVSQIIYFDIEET